ncbi:MAG: hypothetical protein GXN96_02400 [Aquificae bacterium]|nr:hypothetical protein [Aquificota bacterium]
MSLEVILYDPDGEIEYLLTDIFEVTGHSLYVAEKEEDLRELIKHEASLILLPYSALKLWLELLREKVLIPLFLTRSQEEEERLLRRGFSELNFSRIPFNPLELLNKLNLLNRTSYEEVRENGFINTLLKLSAGDREGGLLISSPSGECFVSVKPPGSSCPPEKLREVLSEEHEIQLTDHKEVPRYTYESLADFLSRLLEEKKTRPAVRKEEEGIETLDETLTVLWREYEKGVFRKNLYLLTFRDSERRFTLLVNLDSLASYPLIDRALRERGLSPKDLNLIVITDFEPFNLEVLKKIHLANPKVGVIARSKIGRIIKTSGLAGLKFRAMETIPYLRVNLVTGQSLVFLPVNMSTFECSGVLLVENYGWVFTGKLLGNFNSREEEERKLFHRMYFPCNTVLKKNIKILKKMEDGYRIFPYYGIPYEFRKDLITELLEVSTGMDYEYPQDAEVVVALISRVLKLLEEEEREALKDSLGALVEFDGNEPVSIFTEPYILYERFVCSVVESVSSRESFFKVLHELARYPFYLPPVEV